MSTATGTQRGHRFSSLTPQPPKATRSASRRRFSWWWLLPVLGLVGLWLLPIVVGQTRLLQWALNSATAKLPCRVRVHQASLGWFSPIQLTQLEVFDAKGQPVAIAKGVESDRSLFGLLTNRANLGRFRLERPNITLVLRPDGSNLEDILSKLSTPHNSTGSHPGTDFGLEIVDGTITVVDTAATRQWQIQEVQADLLIPSNPQKAWEITTSGTILGATPAGRFDVNLEMGPHGTPAPGETNTPNAMKLAAQNIPLELFQSPLGRLLGKPIRLSGQFHAALQGGWTAPGQDLALHLRGDARVDGFGLNGAFLGNESLQLAQAQANGQGTWKNGRLEIEQLTAQTDLGNLQASGSLALADLLTQPWPGVLQQTCHVEALLEVPRLTAMLPQTLHLQPGTQITSGQVHLGLASQRQPEGMQWQAALASTPLQAVQAGRVLAWDHPLQVAIDAHETAQGLVVDNLRCQASFLAANGSGSPDQGTLTADLNLNRLVDDLRMLVDLGELRLAGQGKTQLSWQRGEDQAFRAEGNLHLQNFECTLPEHPAWTERELQLSLLATGKTDFTEATRFDTAQLRMKTPQDSLEAQLVQPVASLADGGVWPVDLRAQGHLEGWRPRLAPWMDLQAWQLGGSHQIQSQFTASRDLVEIRNLQVMLDQMVVTGPGMQIQEPRVQLTTAGRWQRATRRLEVGQGSLASQTLTAQLKEAAVALPEEGSAQVRGLLHVQGDLGRLTQWVALARPTPLAWQVSGQFSGDAKLIESGGKTAVQVDSVLQNIAAVNTSRRVIQQPAIRLNGQGTYDSRQGVLQLSRATLTSAMAQADVAAQMAFQNPTRLDLEGRIQYDLEQVSQVLQSVAGPELRFVGRGVCPITYHGPLDLTAAEASAALGWTAAEVYGFRVGPGKLDARLAGGTVNFRPLDLEVSEGKVHLEPRIECTPSSGELLVEGGRIAEQVRVNPAMCAHALQYVAPIVAGVTSAEGSFSMELDRFRIPLADVAQGEFEGRMLVHSIHMGPGPMIQQLALALGYNSPAKIADDSTIDFQLQNGRIYHRGVELTFPDVTVRTQGSVGLDRTLDMLAELTVPRKVQNDQIASVALPDQTFRLPITGTLDRPKTDRVALRQATQQVLQSATQTFLQDQVGRQLNRLLNPSR